MRLLVTGGAGFIGSEFIRQWVLGEHGSVLNLDKLTYAGNLASLRSVEDSPRYQFQKVDICDQAAVAGCFASFQPDAVLHLAAESHVDRSIGGPGAFIHTNIVGTGVLLEAARAYYEQLDAGKKALFRFHHVSTDEVYGSLGEEGYFTEQTAYAPNSPYSASKASSDHLVSSWFQTFGLPTLITNCSNNYGPYQFPEKLIPVVISKALAGQKIPVYGDGKNVRDWLYVGDHARALRQVLEHGRVGETYNVGGGCEKSNIELVQSICRRLDVLAPDPSGEPYERLISFVTDRLGHDFRYAIDDAKLRRELGWRPMESFTSGLDKTIQWYLQNKDWWQDLLEKASVLAQPEVNANQTQPTL